MVVSTWYMSSSHGRWEISLYTSTLSPIIMVQWKITLNERKLIAYTSMMMGERVGFLFESPSSWYDPTNVQLCTFGGGLKKGSQAQPAHTGKTLNTA